MAGAVTTAITAIMAGAGTMGITGTIAAGNGPRREQNIEQARDTGLF